MFEKAFEGGTVLAIREEHFSEDQKECLLEFKVIDSKVWATMLSDLVLCLNEGELFRGELRKSYYVNASRNVQFTWAIYVWGEDNGWIQEAMDDLRPFLSRSVAKPPPTPTRMADPAVRKRQRLVHTEKGPNGVIISTVGLPHTSADRNNPEKLTTGLNDPRKIKAKASLIGRSDSGAPDLPKDDL